MHIFVCTRMYNKSRLGRDVDRWINLSVDAFCVYHLIGSAAVASANASVFIAHLVNIFISCLSWDDWCTSFNVFLPSHQSPSLYLPLSIAHLAFNFSKWRFMIYLHCHPVFSYRKKAANQLVGNQTWDLGVCVYIFNWKHINDYKYTCIENALAHCHCKKKLQCKIRAAKHPSGHT